MVGGILDAVVWIDHGHVFATAMTGNTVLLGVSLLAHDYHQALRHIIPLVCFSLGIFLGWFVLRHAADAHRAHRYALLLQMAGVLLAGAAPAAFPSPPVVALIAVTAAIQVATFQRIGSVNYNTTFVTGNIRTLLEAALDRSTDRNPDAAMPKIYILLPICVGFLSGALLGAAAVPRLHNHAFWISAAVLLAVLLLLQTEHDTGS